MYHSLIVVDNEDIPLGEGLPGIISFDRYLREYPKQNEPKTRIINLCDIENYLSKGYYCSLLAEARRHSVLPSVKTINELRNLDADKEELLPFKSELVKIEDLSLPIECMVYFGEVEQPELKKLAARMFAQFPSPILKLTIGADKLNFDVQVERYSLSRLNASERQVFVNRLTEFTQKVWRTNTHKKRHRWNMAILVDPEEKVPPSNKEAIGRFIKAAAKNGIHAEALSIKQLQNITYFDALFIRETTAIDHYTYRLACKAEKNGLVVMDDPTSILRCCNKVYLHDAFTYQKVPSLRTEVVSDSSEETLDKLESLFTLPLILKMPEGSFSKGVYKVKTRAELKEKLDELYQHTALVLAQEYCYTEYDWRVGVLNGRAIYACRYLMARNHWQIYNHSGKRLVSGGFETLPTFELPKSVLDAALRACKIIGNGLYGVDIKQIDKHAYVLEVNDNPSIDHKVEDVYLGDELYMHIMGEFQRRLEARGK